MVSFTFDAIRPPSSTSAEGSSDDESSVVDAASPRAQFSGLGVDGAPRPESGEPDVVVGVDGGVPVAATDHCGGARLRRHPVAVAEESGVSVREGRAERAG